METEITVAEDTWTIDGAVRATFYLGSERTLAGVRAVVFDENGDPIAHRDLGDIRSEAATDTGEPCGGRRLDVPLELTASAFPYRIELQTPAEAACEDDIRISAVEFREEHTPGQTGTIGDYWSYDEIHCGETPTGTESTPRATRNRETTGTATDS
ncbi:hypothetical protein ACFQER_08595 [Halomicroarcula sp. GCM10025894]|uniref:hypothetical protein n=1 Tax=Halomicroarcula sp. GCM10025894 TaxID=3252673 RepID=UPI003616BBA6